MSLCFFLCPDNQKIRVSSCIKENGCRLGRRCLTLPTLMELGKFREWEGVPSVTQLLKGTYEAFLLITKDYTEKPQKQMFKLLGTSVHASLENNVVESAIMEQRFTDDDTSGGIDILETEGGWNVLTDYKVSGSYKVAKAVGIYADWIDSPTEVYQMKSSPTVNGVKVVRQKGEPKIIKIFKVDPSRQDCTDWILQINKYRIMMEKKGYKVNELRIQAIVRDGNTINAFNNGVEGEVYLINIPILEDSVVEEYFSKKKDDLLVALELKDWEHKCTDDETWNGIKCERYCAVREFCKFMIEEEKTSV